jgi:hypothetical protein
VCRKEEGSVGPSATQGSTSSALGEHIAVTEKVAGHRKASRSSVEASDLRRTVAGTEPPFLRETCPGSNHAPRAQFYLF